MHCAACEVLLEDRVGGLKGVKAVKADLSENKISIELSDKQDLQDLKAKINKALEKDGYSVDINALERKIDLTELLTAAGIALGIFIVFLALQKLGLVNLFSFDNLSYPAIFIIGVLASLSSCMAVVGSLVLTISSRYSKEAKIMPMIAFHIARLVAFFALGGVIGYIGSQFLISKQITFALDILVLVVMVFLAIDLIGIFPKLSKFSLHMPKIFGKKTLEMSQSTSIIAPVLTGILTFFLPCGFTQSMQFYALGTGSFFTGAMTMLVFALGTLPALALISFASVKLSQSKYQSLFYKTSGVLVLLFAVMNFLGALVALGVINPF